MARTRSQPINQPARDNQPDCIGDLKRSDDVAIVDLREADAVLERWLEQADHLPVHVIDRGRYKEHGADRPADSVWTSPLGNACFPPLLTLRVDSIHKSNLSIKTCTHDARARTPNRAPLQKLRLRRAGARRQALRDKYSPFAAQHRVDRG